MREDGRANGRPDHDGEALQRQVVKLPGSRQGEMLQELGGGGVP